MAKLSRPRYGSLQFWPRKRAEKAVPRVNWSAVKGQEGFQGILAYKAGMATAIVKDKTDKSMTAGRKISIPVTILEVPHFKIFSVRFYKNGKVTKDVVVSQDKELRRVVKVPKNIGKLEDVKDFDDIRVIIYPVLKSAFKKTPDMAEVAINSSNKLEFVKQHIGKELSIKELFKSELVDVRGLTKGKGFQGPVARYGIGLRQHKSEKGVRRPGSLGPWHPAHVTFRIPMAGQLGMFTRVHYNLKPILIGKLGEHGINELSLNHYGKINGEFIILQGSVQGPQKRVILITQAIRPTKKQLKKKYEFVELLR